MAPESGAAADPCYAGGIRPMRRSSWNRRAKVIMTTAHSDRDNVLGRSHSGLLFHLPDALEGFLPPAA